MLHFYTIQIVQIHMKTALHKSYIFLWDRVRTQIYISCFFLLYVSIRIILYNSYEITTTLMFSCEIGLEYTALCDAYIFFYKFHI